MPSLIELLEVVRHQCRAAGCQLSEQHWTRLGLDVRKRWPGERVYIAPATSRKDPGRAEQIRQAANRLPTGVVAKSYAVTESYVRRVVKKR